MKAYSVQPDMVKFIPDYHQMIDGVRVVNEHTLFVILNKAQRMAFSTWQQLPSI